MVTVHMTLAPRAGIDLTLNMCDERTHIDPLLTMWF